MKEIYRPNHEAMWPRRYLIYNNRIEKIGTEYFGSLGIKAFYVDSITIQNNLIRDVPYSGIDVGWGWFADEVVLQAKNAKIRNNLIDSYLTELKDGAAIYSPNPVFGSAIENNYIKNMVGDWPDPAIYNDGCGAYWTISANVIERANRWLGQQSWGGQLKRDIYAAGNFSTTGECSIFGVNRVVEGLGVFPDAAWPAEAKQIIAKAGLTDEPVPDLPARESEVAVIIDNSSEAFQTDPGGWETDMHIMAVRHGYYGEDYAYTGESAQVQGKYAQWTWKADESGDYHVYIRYPTGAFGAEYVPVQVTVGEESDEPGFIPTFDQKNSVYDNQWIFLGQYACEAGQEIRVRMYASGSGVTAADAVKIVKLESGAPSGLSELGVSMKPVPSDAKLEEDDYFVWGGSAVRGPDGRYHLYYSRWPKSTGFQGWVTHSEIAHAVGDTPTGPFEPVGVALGARDGQFWDAHVAHNPNVHQFGGKFYLYYMGNRGDRQLVGNANELNWDHRNRQRIGVAVSDSPDGPWRRFDKPLIDVSDDASESDSLCVSNPSVAQMADGRYLMVYKAVGQEKPLPFGGPVVHQVAVADSPVGPFTKLDEFAFTVPGNDFPVEDPYVWYDAQREQYFAIVKDQDGDFTGVKPSLALFSSEDGFEWAPVEKPLIMANRIDWEDAGAQAFRMERPQMLIEAGKPVALYLSVLEEEHDNTSYNVHIPLRSR